MFAFVKIDLLVTLLAVGLFSGRATATPAPIHAPELIERQAATTKLTADEIAAFLPYTHYASTGYCQPAATLAWNCGKNCKANPQFVPVASGGDGDATQLWFVGFDPTLNEVIVSHQGTDFSEIGPGLDLDIILESLDSDLFPGVRPKIMVHSGFALAQSRSAAHVLAAVNKAITKFGTNKVTVTGHSLGYGMPRVGNQEFANYVDRHPISVTHINNNEDIVPILPEEFLGFHHPSGEIHIVDSDTWRSCPGQDNTDNKCIVGDVPTIFDGDTGDHIGPYDGVKMGC
ncbi:lipase [Cerioporus squamosus]|nr:lipase [Cerioporus squamosus]